MIQFEPWGPTKLCRRCGQWLPFDAAFFYRHSRSLSGLNPTCKVCMAESLRRRKERAEAMLKPYPPYERWAVYKVEKLR